jgi:hypothetical protein
MAPFIQTANVTLSGSGSTTIVTNPFKTLAQAATHGEQRGAVIRVFSFNYQNQNSTANPLVTWQDSNLSNIAGPFIIPVSTGNWTERASPPGFLFETTRNTSSGVGFDLTINSNVAVAAQVFCEYAISFVPGRVGG